MTDRLRLDVALTTQGYTQSREKAKALILSGNVYVNGEQISSKAGTLIFCDSVIEIKGDTKKYVSRGGLKLAKAIELYGIQLDGCVCMDIGASTGGFTDCMLQNGAAKVYAVDVGHGQLAKSIMEDKRVLNMEGTNIRYLTDKQVSEPIDFISVDVSFISLTLVLPTLQRLLKEEGSALCLVKPQFEAGRSRVGKRGVVRELSTHVAVLRKIYDFLAELGFAVVGATYSPIKGPEGNIEYLYYIKKNSQLDAICFDEVEQMAKCSHGELGLKHI